LVATSFCFLSAASCFLDLSFAFGDLSPMVITPVVWETVMVPHSLGQVHGNRGSSASGGVLRWCGV
jgi:hypothetical protein